MRKMNVQVKLPQEPTLYRVAHDVIQKMMENAGIFGVILDKDSDEMLGILLDEEHFMISIDKVSHVIKDYLGHLVPDDEDGVSAGQEGSCDTDHDE